MSKNTQLGNLVNGIYVSSSGSSVGVKTTTPRATLDVNGNIYSNDIWIADTYGILFGNLTTGTSYAYIAGIGATGASSYLSFSTNAGEKMRIDNNGKVGIGTTSPSELLTISAAQPNSVINYTSASDYGRMYFSESGTFKAAIQFMGSTFVSTARRNALEIVNTTTGDLALGTGDARTFYIKNAGNVGIGTSSPVGEGSDDIVTQIHNPATTGAARAMIRLTNGYTGSTWGNGSFITVDSAQGLYIGNSEAAPMLLFTSGAERMRITAAGNVGISNTSPDTAYDAGNWFSAKGLTIGNTSTTAGLQIVSSPTSTLSSIRFGDGSDSLYDQGFINYSHNLDRLSLGANRNTTMVLTSSNNVLIGTTTDNGYKLNVTGSIYSSSSIVSNGSMYAVGGIGSQGGIYIDYGYAFGLNSNTQNAANAWNFYVSSSFSNYLRFFYGGTGVGSGSAKFQIDTGGGYTGLSDVNKKKDISLSTLGLAEIMQLKPSTFKFKDDEKQEEQIGFIAQEVKDIIPQAYYEDEEGDDKFIGLKQTAFIPVLVKAIQELSAEITLLKNK